MMVQMSKNPNNNPLDMLKEYINDYIQIMEKINKDRLKSAEKEMKLVQLEFQAFNMLRQNLTNLETNGVS